VISPDGVVVVSGDTAICDEVEQMAQGADVLVHEAMRTTALQGLLADPEAVAAYHSDTVEIGELAARAGVTTLVLTHFIPAPTAEAEEAAYLADVRQGGFDGEVVVARDLDTITVGEPFLR
jgi:ribonuclease Z